MHGVRQIVRFNWPLYVRAILVVLVSIVLLLRAPLPEPIRLAGYATTALIVFWLVGSLAASWLIYDWSRLMKWTWIADALKPRPGVWINIHAGLDESSLTLRALFPESRGQVFDIFNPVTMTEPSIARARRLVTNASEAAPVDVRHLPVTTATADAALLLLSAHELRTDDSRTALFGELHRVLAPAGRVIVAEHLRNWANLLAFGPGFLHFHSRRTWRRCFAKAHLATVSEFSITPFVRIFILRRSS